MTTADIQRPTPNPWLVLGLICLPVFIGSLDLTIVSAFLPEIIVNLGLPLQSTLDDAAWVVTGYLLAYAISMTFMGRISDLAGRRHVYIACLLIFIVGSVLVATAHLWPSDFLYSIFRRLQQRPEREMVTLLAIIIGRVVQALGAGALVPVSLALVGDIFPPQRRAQPLGIIGAVDTLGWVLGHLYGGVLVNFFASNQEGFSNFLSSLGLNWPPPDWRTLFWINLPVSLLGLAFTLYALRNVREQRVSGRFDLLGTLLIAAALIGLIVGLGANVEVSGSTASFEDLSPLPPYAGPALLLALGCFVAFIIVEARVRDPLIDLRLFRHRHLSSASLVNLCVGFCLMIGLVSVPILINVRIGMEEPEAAAVIAPDAQATTTEIAAPIGDDNNSLAQAALQVGVLLSALTVPMALAAVPGGWLTERWGYRRVTVIGLALALLGFGLIWRTWVLDTSNAVIAVEMALVGVGLGLTFSPISAAVINSAEAERRGVASALVIILRLIGMTIAVSSLTTLALQRVSVLAGLELGAGAVDPNVFLEVYARITVQVLAELGLLGALVCAAALVPAALGLRQGGTDPLPGRPRQEQAAKTIRD